MGVNHRLMVCGRRRGERPCGCLREGRCLFVRGRYHEQKAWQTQCSFVEREANTQGGDLSAGCQQCGSTLVLRNESEPRSLIELSERGLLGSLS